MPSPHTTVGEKARIEVNEDPGSNSMRNIRGIHIMSLSIVFMVISLALCVLVIIETFEVSEHYAALDRTTENATLCVQAATQAERASDLLTNESRLYAATLNTNHVRHYFEEAHLDRNREKVIEAIETSCPNEKVVELFKSAMDRSFELMNIEEYAMCLIIVAQGYNPADVVQDLEGVKLTPEDLTLSADAKIAKASNILSSDNYERAKAAIDESLSQASEIVLEDSLSARNDASTGLSNAIFWQRLFIVLLCIMTVLTFAMIMLLVVRPLRIYIKRIKEDQQLDIVGAYEFKYLAITYNDIYGLKLANEKSLQSMAKHDPLTGALNRLAFDQAIEYLKDTSIPVCLLLIDIDKFKEINDTYGHATGDKVLCMLAELLGARFRTTDTVARIGGDEFAVLALDFTPAEESIIREKIAGINERLGSPRNTPPVSISVGCAFSPKGYTDELFEQADKALYEVKTHGRKGMEVFR